MDPETLMKSVDLSGDRRIFFWQTTGDLIVPQFNLNKCLSAATASAVSQGVNVTQKVQYYLDTVVYPANTGTRSIDFCDNHLVSMFMNVTKYYDILTTFFGPM